MTDPILETRSFQSTVQAPARGVIDDWGGGADGLDSVRSSALIQRVRWHTGLSQADFARTYRIDADHLRALERGVVEPDTALVAYLTVIDRSPEMVRAALATC
ncbi:MAG: hypothetical protein WDM92_03485 [Caulobacteraceae bacterium]